MPVERCKMRDQDGTPAGRRIKPQDRPGMSWSWKATASERTFPKQRTSEVGRTPAKAQVRWDSGRREWAKLPKKGSERPGRTSEYTWELTRAEDEDGNRRRLLQRSVEMIRCYQCSNMGHYARDCPERIGSVGAQRQTSLTSGAAGNQNARK